MRQSWCSGYDDGDDECDSVVRTFECGLGSLLCGRGFFSVQFITVALTFIVFDLEVLFLVLMLLGNNNSVYTAWFGTAFITAVLFGLMYEVGNGLVEWVL